MKSAWPEAERLEADSRTRSWPGARTLHWQIIMLDIQRVWHRYYQNSLSESFNVKDHITRPQQRNLRHVLKHDTSSKMDDIIRRRSVCLACVN